VKVHSNLGDSPARLPPGRGLLRFEREFPVKVAKTMPAPTGVIELAGRRMSGSGHKQTFH